MVRTMHRLMHIVVCDAAPCVHTLPTLIWSWHHVLPYSICGLPHQCIKNLLLLAVRALALQTRVPI